MAAEPRIDASGIGFERLPHLRGQRLNTGFSAGLEAQNPHQPVIAEAGAADQFRQPAGADSPVQVHLPHAIAGMDVAQGEIGVLLGLGEDVGNGMAVGRDLDRGDQAEQGYRAVKSGQTRAQPQPSSADFNNGYEDDERQRYENRSL